MGAFAKKAAGGMGTFGVFIIHEKTFIAFGSMSLESMFPAAMDAAGGRLFALRRDMPCLPASRALAETRGVFPFAWKDASIEHVEGGAKNLSFKAPSGILNLKDDR